MDLPFSATSALSAAKLPPLAAWRPCHQLAHVQFTKVIFVFAFAAACIGRAAAADWKIIRADDRDYVSFANVAQCYQFPNYTRVSRTVALRGEGRVLRAQAGTSEFYIDGVRFFSNFPLLANRDENLISALGVAKFIEPVLRPNKSEAQRKSSRWCSIRDTAAKIAELPNPEPLLAQAIRELLRIKKVNGYYCSPALGRVTYGM